MGMAQTENRVLRGMFGPKRDEVTGGLRKLLNRAPVRSSGIWVNKVALGQVFSEYFGFPCQFSFHRLLHVYYHLSSGAGTIAN
jgi:hypothetical protein